MKSFHRLVKILGLSKAIFACEEKLPKRWMDQLSFEELDSISTPAPQKVIVSAIRMMHQRIKELQTTAGNTDFKEYWMTLYSKIGSMGSDDPDLGKIVRETRALVESGFSGNFEDWEFVGDHGYCCKPHSLRPTAIESMLKLAKTREEYWQTFKNAYWAEDASGDDDKVTQKELKQRHQKREKRHEDIRVETLNHCFNLSSTSEEWFRVYTEYAPPDLRPDLAEYIADIEKSAHALAKMKEAIYSEIEEGKLEDINEFAWPLVVIEAGPNFKDRKKVLDWFVEHLLLKQLGGATAGAWLELQKTVHHRNMLDDSEYDAICKEFRHNAVLVAAKANTPAAYYDLLDTKWGGSQYLSKKLLEFSDEDLAMILNRLYNFPDYHFGDLTFLWNCWNALSQRKQAFYSSLTFDDKKLLKKMGKLVAQ